MGHMKFPLPQNTAPEESICIQVMVPADTEWLAVFWGWFQALCSARNHQDDPSHTALVVASAWQDIYDQAKESECANSMDVRQNEELPCILEKQVSETWTPFADLKLCPPQIRVASGIIQYSTDGGLTWQNVDQSTDDPEYDPRQDAPLNPVRTGSNIPCLASANATACFVELHREIVDWYNDAIVVLIFCGAISAMLQVFFGVGWMSFSMTVNYMTYVNAILGHTGALTVESFTETIQDELTNILYCNADLSGRWDAAAFSRILYALTFKTGDMWELIKIYVENIGGYVGLNNAGTTTSVTSYDCSGMECGEWCHVWFGGSGDYEHYTLVAGTLISGGIRADSHEASQNMAHIAFNLPAGDYVVTQVKANWTNPGGGPRGTVMLDETYWSGSGEICTTWPGPITCSGLSIEPGHYIGFQLNADYNYQPVLIGFEIRGTGTNPWFANCTE